MMVTWCQQGARPGRASGFLPRVSNRKARGGGRGRGRAKHGGRRQGRRCHWRSSEEVTPARVLLLAGGTRQEGSRGPMMAITAYPVAACSSTQLRAARGRRMTADSAPAA